MIWRRTSNENQAPPGEWKQTLVVSAEHQHQSRELSKGQGISLTINHEEPHRELGGGSSRGPPKAETLCQLAFAVGQSIPKHPYNLNTTTVCLAHSVGALPPNEG